MLKMLKVVVHRQNGSPEFFQPEGVLHKELERAAGAPIVYKLYTELISEDELDGLLAECKQADVVILDYKTHPTYYDWNDSWGKYPTSEACKAAKAIKKNPHVRLFAPTSRRNEGYVFPIHEIAMPISCYNSKIVIATIKELAQQL